MFLAHFNLLGEHEVREVVLLRLLTYRSAITSIHTLSRLFAFFDVGVFSFNGLNIGGLTLYNISMKIHLVLIFNTHMKYLH